MLSFLFVFCMFEKAARPRCHDVWAVTLQVYKLLPQLPLACSFGVAALQLATTPDPPGSFTVLRTADHPQWGVRNLAKVRVPTSPLQPLPLRLLLWTGRVGVESPALFANVASVMRCVLVFIWFTLSLAPAPTVSPLFPRIFVETIVF